MRLNPTTIAYIEHAVTTALEQAPTGGFVPIRLSHASSDVPIIAIIGAGKGADVLIAMLTKCGAKPTSL
jgi:hypothetical protein